MKNRKERHTGYYIFWGIIILLAIVILIYSFINSPERESMRKIESSRDKLDNDKDGKACETLP